MTRRPNRRGRDEPPQVKVLLDQLCVKLGFCLPPAEISRLVDTPPPRIEDFVDAVFSAEGVDAGHSRQLYRQVRDLVTEHFHRWEDGRPKRGRD